MKTILILIALLASCALPAQTTNTYVSEPFVFSGRQRVFPCGISFWRNGEEPVWKQQGTLQQKQFTPTTNHLSIAATNPAIMVQALELSSGANHCGVGSVSWTDDGFSSNLYSFNIQWPTNKSLQFPTNKNVPVLAVGFLETTNSP